MKSPAVTDMLGAVPLSTMPKDLTTTPRSARSDAFRSLGRAMTAAHSLTASASPDPISAARTGAAGSSVERIREQVAQAIGAHRFGLWFENGAAISVVGDDVEVRAANHYVSDWITRNFRETLDRVVRDVLGAGSSVRVAVTELHNEATPDASHDASPASSSGTAARAKVSARAARHDAEQTASNQADGTGSADTRVRWSEPRGATSAAPRLPRQQSLRKLEDFVVGDSNRVAFAASEQFGSGAADAPPILFLHGDCGVGKTHLLQGICRRRLERTPRGVVRYVTAEQFTNEYIASVRAGNLDDFRKRLRRVDLLAIDDIHFFANKTATQAEFLHTIDAIDLSGARVALVSDEHPRHIRRFSQSLVSRFLSGMVVKLERPDRTTRVALVQRLARERGLDLTSAAEDAVAGRCAGSIREVEGAITRLGAMVELEGVRGQIGPGTVERLLGNESALALGAQPIRLGRIVEGVCERLRVSREDLLGSGRHARTVVARGLVAHLARELTTHSYPEIARALGRDTHSAVHTAARRLRSMVDADERVVAGGESIREVVDQLRHDLARGAKP